MRLDLLQRLKNKEEVALMEMMNLYGDHLLRIAILLVKDRFVAEEVVQDTFVIAFQKIDQLNDVNKLKNWLIIIATNECRRRMRKWSWKHIFLHKEDSYEANIVDDSEWQPEQSLLVNFRDTQIHEAIQQIPYKYREVVTLYYFQELTIKEITDAINEKENTVKTRLARGRAQLRKLIEKGGEDLVK